jgi:hypothetical protein
VSPGDLSRYSYELAEAVGQWGTHNLPLLDQVKSVRWDEIPLPAQAAIAKRLRQDFREQFAKMAIAEGVPPNTITCKAEFPNCMNVAGNLELVGDYYALLLGEHGDKIADAATRVARGSTVNSVEQWERIRRLDERLAQFWALVPKAAVFAQLGYPEDPVAAASCHRTRRRTQKARFACADPQTAAEMRAAVEAIPPTPFSVAVRELGDLDNDGRIEYGLDLSSVHAMNTVVFGSDKRGCAYEVTIEHGGMVDEVLRTTQLGWKDLAVGIPVNQFAGEPNGCWVTVRAEFSGSAYRPVALLRVEPNSSSGHEDNLATCSALAKEMIVRDGP